MSVLSKLHALLLKTERLLVLTLLLSMILIAVAQILLRNIAGGGLLWADGFTRTGVLWLAMLGAMLASRKTSHISIDVFLQRLPQRTQSVAISFNRFATALISFTAAWFSLSLVSQEFDYGDIAFADIPNWLCQSILPIAFMIIGLRYLLAMFTHPEQDKPA